MQTKEFRRVEPWTMEERRQILRWVVALFWKPTNPSFKTEARAEGITPLIATSTILNVLIWSFQYGASTTVACDWFVAKSDEVIDYCSGFRPFCIWTECGRVLSMWVWSGLPRPASSYGPEWREVRSYQALPCYLNTITWVVTYPGIVTQMKYDVFLNGWKGEL